LVKTDGGKEERGKREGKGEEQREKSLSKGQLGALGLKKGGQKRERERDGMQMQKNNYGTNGVCAGAPHFGGGVKKKGGGEGRGAKIPKRTEKKQMPYILSVYAQRRKSQERVKKGEKIADTPWHSQESRKKKETKLLWGGAQFSMGAPIQKRGELGKKKLGETMELKKGVSCERTRNYKKGIKNPKNRGEGKGHGNSRYFNARGFHRGGGKKRTKRGAPQKRKTLQKNNKKGGPSGLSGCGGGRKNEKKKGEKKKGRVRTSKNSFVERGGNPGTPASQQGHMNLSSTETRRKQKKKDVQKRSGHWGEN